MRSDIFVSRLIQYFDVSILPYGPVSVQVSACAHILIHIHRMYQRYCIYISMGYVSISRHKAQSHRYSSTAFITDGYNLKELLCSFYRLQPSALCVPFCWHSRRAEFSVPVQSRLRFAAPKNNAPSRHGLSVHLDRQLP